MLSKLGKEKVVGLKVNFSNQQLYKSKICLFFMDVKILKQEKNVIEVEIENLTIAELLRAYLNKENIGMSAWRREHPTKNPVLRLEADNAKKILLNTIEKVQKELDNFSDEFKKAK